VAYNFEQKLSKMVSVRDTLYDEQMAIKRGKGIFDDMAADANYWSADFSIEDIEDFQISFPSQPEQAQAKQA
jgi:hypothetical protein